MYCDNMLQLICDCCGKTLDLEFGENISVAMRHNRWIPIAERKVVCPDCSRKMDIFCTFQKGEDGKYNVTEMAFTTADEAEYWCEKHGGVWKMIFLHDGVFYKRPEGDEGTREYKHSIYKVDEEC